MRFLPAVAIAALIAVGCGDDGTTSTDPSTSTTEVAGGAPATPSDAQPTDGSGDDRLPWPTTVDEFDQRWTVEIVDRLPHDATAFTQGLEYGEGGLWESTGRYGESTLRLTDDRTGEVREVRPIDDDHFGEGLTLVDGRPLQLTWRAGVAYHHSADLATAERLPYDGEGWGICFDGGAVWMTDGTSTLSRRTADLTVVETVEVTRGGMPVSALNELECVGDHVLANVWQTDEIVVIEPTTGAVVATIDAAALRAEIDPTDAGAVLNGIADRGDGTLLLAGKLWPTHFVVELVEASPTG